MQILIGQQIENLAAEERRVLQIAAVSGAEFSAAGIAATPGLDVQAVEEICDRLVQRQQFITSRGSHDWPDGTVANRYAFVHAMYQEGLGSRVSEARRVEWQGRIAAREEQAYGANVRDIAAQLAVRFEAARQYDRGVKYFELAARNALAGNAYIEAARLYGKAIDMLPLARLDDPTKVELRMLLPRSVAVIVTQGYATDEIEKIHHRALALARDRGDQSAVVRVLHSIWTTYIAQGQLHKARSLAIEISDHAELTSDKTALLQAHAKLGQTSFHLGELAMARAYFENALAISADMPDEERARVAGYLAWTLWYLGFPDAACRMAHDSLQLARTLKGHYGLVFALGLRRLDTRLPRRAARGRSSGRRAVRDVLGVRPAVLDHLELLPEGPDPEQARRLRGRPGAHAAIGDRLSRDGCADRPGAFHDRAGRDGAGGGRLRPRPRHHRGGARDLHQDRQPLSCRRHPSRPGRAADRRQPRRGRRAPAPAFAERGAQQRRTQPGAPDPDHAGEAVARLAMQLKATRDAFTEGLDTIDLRHADEVLARA